jgi:hypothetical protein
MAISGHRVYHRRLVKPCPTKEGKGRRSAEFHLSTSACPVRVIVHDFELEVNEYAKLGRHVPFCRPNACPLCGRDRLTGHGVRRRTVWLRNGATGIELYVRRFACKGCPAAAPGCNSVIFTMLPAFVHPRKRYPLSEIDPIIRDRFVGDVSFTVTERRYSSPARSTQHSWCQGFRSAAPLWLPTLTAWLSDRRPTTLIRSVTKDDAVALLVMTVLALSVWLPHRGEAEECLLRLLWTWGGPRCGLDLLPPTRSRKVVRGPTS